MAPQISGTSIPSWVVRGVWRGMVALDYIGPRGMRNDPAPEESLRRSSKAPGTGTGRSGELAPRRVGVRTSLGRGFLSVDRRPGSHGERSTRRVSRGPKPAPRPHNRIFVETPSRYREPSRNHRRQGVSAGQERLGPASVGDALAFGSRKSLW